MSQDVLPDKAEPSPGPGEQEPKDSSTSKPPKKRTRAPKEQSALLSSFTIRNPAWTYILIDTVSAVAAEARQDEGIDPITAHLYLTAALKQFLGLHGAAIVFHILHTSAGGICIRVPRQDASAVIAAVGGWAGQRGQGLVVKQWSCWGPGHGPQERGQALFQ